MPTPHPRVHRAQDPHWDQIQARPASGELSCLPAVLNLAGPELSVTTGMLSLVSKPCSAVDLRVFSELRDPS